MITFEAQLSDMNRTDLADLAKAAKIAGRSKMNKAQLVEALTLAKADVLATQSEAVQVFYAEADAIADAEQAAEIKPGRCLVRVAETGKNFEQCVREHGHDGEHSTTREPAPVKYANLSPTARALAIASDARDAAWKIAYEAEGTAFQESADAVAKAAEESYRAAGEAHHAARVAAGDFLPRSEREARESKPFALHYDDAEGVLIAAALREKSDDERKLSETLRIEHDGIGAGQADNRAGLLGLIADRVHAPAEEKPFHRQVKDAIGLRW
jgi:hypothetical protein